MKVGGEGDYYFDSDVTKAFQIYLTRLVPNDQQLLTESGIQATYRLLSASKGGNLTFVGSATAYIAAKLNQAKVPPHIVAPPSTPPNTHPPPPPAHTVPTNSLTRPS